MSSKKAKIIQTEQLRVVSSGSKIWNQLVIFFVIGLLPLIFPTKISVPNQWILFFNLAIALLSSFVYELWRARLQKEGKSIQKVMTLQLLTSVVLLAIFLHFFTRINGPLFILYLLTVMESALNLNVSLPNIVVGVMMFSTIGEFVYLVMIKEIILNLISMVELAVRVTALIFMRSYGLSLAQNIILERKARSRAQKAEGLVKEQLVELKNANIKLKGLDRLKDEFVSIASHELRTPMTVINNYLWMVLHGKAGEISQKQKLYLDRAAISSQRLIALVNDMLTISRIQRGKIMVKSESGDLLELAKGVVEELKIKAKEKKLKLSLKEPEKKLPQVLLDKERIREALVNLIGNALKFTPEKGEIVVSFKRKGQWMTALVADTGPGIAQEDLPKLFKKFGRLDRSFATVAETRGTGLGLYICKQIIDLHHGKIGVKSELGKGSTFYFSLKVAKKK